MDTSKMKIITLMDCVQVVEEEVVEGMEEEEHTEDHETEEEHAHGEEKEDAHAHGEQEPEYDEHVWTSPKNVKRIVQKISDALCEADTANAAFYQTNTEDYLTKLDELDSKFQDAVDNSKRKTIVFGDRFPFRYFADAYGLEYYAAFPGCSTETEASAATVKFLIDKINTEKIPVVFHIELSNEKMADTISEATGAKVLLMHACHNISKSDFERGKSYIELMTDNVEALKEALQ
jgi:zinc transport system substrate-binding protein